MNKKKKKTFFKRSALALIGLLFVSIFAAPLVMADGGYSWTDQSGSGSSQSWASVTSSVNGQYLAAAAQSGYIYTSSNYGVTWTEQSASGSQLWLDMASSSDGSQLAAVAEESDYVYISTDYGVQWTSHSIPGAEYLSGISSSGNGQYLTAVDYDGYIYTSDNYGATWTTVNSMGSQDWSGVTASSSGQYLAATDSNSGIYTSSNYGVTWSEQSGSGSKDWAKIASSSSGQYLVAGVWNGNVYTSANYGSTWSATSLPTGYWDGMNSSASGANLIAMGDLGGNVYTSNNYGSTWTEQSDLPSESYWQAAASSSDGSLVVLVGCFLDIQTGVNSSLTVDPPGISNQSANVTTNGSVTVDVLSGISGADPSTLTIISGPSHGTAVDPVGDITYTPDAGYTGSDSLVYQVCSILDSLTCGQATLTFDITNVQTTAGSPDTGYGAPTDRTPIIVLASAGAITLGIGLTFLYRQRTTKSH